MNIKSISKRNNMMYLRSCKVSFVFPPYKSTNNSIPAFPILSDEEDGFIKTSHNCCALRSLQKEKNSCFSFVLNRSSVTSSKHMNYK